MTRLDLNAGRAAEIYRAWEALDDASQVLVRAESLVMLLRAAADVEDHHRFGAGMACDYLVELKEKLVDAQALIRPRVSRASKASR